jgi:hypothetical protein
MARALDEEDRVLDELAEEKEGEASDQEDALFVQSDGEVWTWTFQLIPQIGYCWLL